RRTSDLVEGPGSGGLNLECGRAALVVRIADDPVRGLNSVPKGQQRRRERANIHGVLDESLAVVLHTELLSHAANHIPHPTPGGDVSLFSVPRAAARAQNTDEYTWACHGPAHHSRGWQCAGPCRGGIAACPPLRGSDEQTRTSCTAQTARGRESTNPARTCTSSGSIT